MSLESSRVEEDSMATDANDKQACFILFQKFVREVS